MLDWLHTYALSDLVPFGPEAYSRLFVGHNARYWPAPLVGALVGALALGGALRGRRRTAIGLLAASWGWLGWAFYGQSYAQLNWAGAELALVCYGQAGLLLAMAGRGAFDLPVEGHAPGPLERRGRRVGWSIALTALTLYPAIDLLLGRPWRGVELVGHAPEPTAWFTAGLVLAIGRWRVLALAVPALIIAVGVATLWVLTQAAGAGG